MNKYQDALDFIVKNSCPSKCACSECNLENVCNSLAKDKINILQELIDRQEKHEWRDLRKDPNNLPEENKKLLVCYVSNGKKTADNSYYYAETSSIDCNLNPFLKRIAWKYIDEFEDK